MTPRRIASARLARLWRDLRAAVTLRRHERRWSTYALRLLVLGMLFALPVKKLLQLGPLDGAVALFKAALAAALVAGALGAWFAIEAIWRRRALRAGGERPA
ncbi:MAG: hypothetical protein ACFCUS_00405 [Rubrimonas sp.]|uniref:hypothetical protein n=1 Tax=Rubrimonas sp. TaxID=2036015 RepID=UPI002FDE92E8